MDTKPSTNKPLAGVKIVDFTRVFAGPYCTMLLGDLGADVVKIEIPGTGDALRNQGPPFHHGLGITYLAANRNKRSLTLDMQTDAGKELAYRLVMQADVLVENFRPDVMPRLGLGYERFREERPDLVYASISGLGADGPDMRQGAFDLTIQAIGGYMSITGERDGSPIKLGTSAFDMIAGMNAQTAILAALLQKNTTGLGQKIETSLLEGEVAFLANAALEYLLTGSNPGKWGSEHSQLVPYKAFKTADGYAVIGAGYQNLFEAFVKVLGCEQLITDARFVDVAGRVTNRDALYAILDPEVAKHPTQELVDRLDQVKVPASPVNNMEQVLTHRQVKHRGMVRMTEHPTYGTMPQLGPAAKYSAFDVAADWTAPPLLGEHSDEILGDWLKVDATEIATLRANKII